MSSISPLAQRLAPVIEDLNKLLLSYRKEFFAHQPDDDPSEHITLWVKTVLWPLFSTILDEENDTVRRLLAAAQVNCVKDGTLQLFHLVTMGEAEVRRINDEVGNELKK